ncbi:uncharacterized protein G2W53_014028 [Senna tora]|uniref:Uncharacterized protein n=1 Tax=Senna tora TaxID=362788 RepID=A0A834WPX8_9FABA|nr:uncharacterized protein G2W53_014028 [Senna tora]
MKGKPTSYAVNAWEEEGEFDLGIS